MVLQGASRNAVLQGASHNAVLQGAKDKALLRYVKGQCEHTEFHDAACCSRLPSSQHCHLAVSPISAPEPAAQMQPDDQRMQSETQLPPQEDLEEEIPHLIQHKWCSAVRTSVML